MSERPQDELDPEAAHRLLKEPLLDLLYRLEKLEAGAGLLPDGLTRLPSFETGPEQDAALADMAIRLSALERKFEE